MSEPRQLSPEEAVDKALLYAFQLSTIDYQDIKNWRAPEGFIRALAQDGYGVTALVKPGPEPLDVDRLGLSDEQANILRGHLASRQQTVSEFLGDMLMEYGLGRANGKEYSPAIEETT